MANKLKEGEDFYYNSQGLMVLTEKFLKTRGYCCQSGCLHCPYGYRNKVNSDIPAELQAGNSDSKVDDYLAWKYQEYLDQEES